MPSEEKYIRITNRINDTKLFHKHISVDLKNLTAYSNEIALELTQIEFKILILLLRKADDVVTREEIKEFIWPSINVGDKTINTHLTNLRAKIETETLKIISIKGKGISFAANLI